MRKQWPISCTGRLGGCLADDPPWQRPGREIRQQRQARQGEDGDLQRLESRIGVETHCFSHLLRCCRCALQDSVQVVVADE